MDNQLPHNDDFWRTVGKILLKTLWEKKKMLITSIFLFSRNGFHPVKYKFNVLVTIKLLSANAFNLGKPKILSSGKVRFV